jgi:hypothetical protein
MNMKHNWALISQLKNGYPNFKPTKVTNQKTPKSIIDQCGVQPSAVPKLTAKFSYFLETTHKLIDSKKDGNKNHNK